MAVLLKKIGCCCVTDGSIDNQSKKKLNDHKYCSCRESRKQRVKMKSCDDKQAFIYEEVSEALDYDFTKNVEEVGLRVTEPAVPFSHELKYALHPQSNIIIQGVVHTKAFRFGINLTVGRNEWPDIAFHFNPRLDQRYVARNSRLEGRWGREEGNGHQKFPFERGQPFCVEFFLTHSEFLVAVNGVHYCSYTYRTSLLNITDMEVTGAVSLTLVHLRSTTHYPSSPESIPNRFILTLKSDGTTKHNTQITPVYGRLQDKVKSSSEIVINGRVKLLPISFSVNLQEGMDIWPHPEIPLHISVRFNQEGEFIVVANSWLTDGWGKEELNRKQLFTPGAEFTLRISCLEDAFIVRVDDHHLLAFKHRMPFSNIDTIFIQGDINLYDFRIQL